MPKRPRVKALLEVEMPKKCMLRWCEADFEFKKLKLLHLVQNTSKDSLKKCMRLWREARFEVNMSKTAPQPQTLESGGVQNCTRLWRQTHVEVSTERAPHVRTSSDSFWQLRCRKSTCRCGTKHILKATNMWETTLDAESWVFVAGRRNGLCTLPTVSQTCGLYSTFKNDDKHGRFKRIWKNASRLAGAIQEISPSDMLGGQGAVPERGCILENQIFRFASLPR